MSFKIVKQILSIYFVLLGVNLAYAESWESCISGALSQCGTFGGNPSVYACDDWTGEMEACFSCTDIPGDLPTDPTWEFFLGCGGPEPSKLHNNAECSSCPSTQAGSIIDETHRNYIKSVPVRGTNLSLVYASNKVVERSDDYKIDFEVFETTPTFISSYDVKISIAGRVITFTNPASTHNVVWTWDKLNNLSQVVKKPMPVTLELTMAGQTIPMEFVLGNANIEQYGLGSWAISNHHFYGAEAKRLYLGSGEMLNAESVSMGGGIRAVISDTSDEVYTFDGRGYHISTVHALTGETLQSFSYNGSGHLTKITDAYGNETLILRDGSGNFTGVESPDGQVTTSALTSNKVTSFTTPEGDIYSMTYNTSSAMLETFTKPTGQVTTFHLDAGGSLEKVSYNGGNFFEYLFGGVSDNVKEYVRETALGREKTIRVSQVPGGILTETVSPLGVTESVGELFGAEGGFEWKKGDSERTTEMTEDPRFGGLRRVPSQITEKEGSKTRLTQYSRSAVLSNPLDVFSIITLTTTQNVNGRISSDVYTNSTKTWLSTSPEGRTLKAVIDEYGSPISEQVGIQ